MSATPSRQSEAKRHKHAFAALFFTFGQYGRQDVHVHPCIHGESGDCARALIGHGRRCDGDPANHWRETLDGGDDV